MEQEQAEAAGPAEDPAPGRQAGLATRILIALLLGIAVGVFFGELVAPLGLIADAFIGLLEMTVLPFIVVALTANLARLSLGDGLALIGTAAKVLLVIWAAGLAAIVLVPMALPQFDQGSFYLPNFVETQSPVDFMELFIPRNVFHSLSDNLVPAIVLFCIFIGVALISVPKKQVLIDALDALGEALQRVNAMVVKLTPIGVFAIGAHTAGTLDVSELGRLQAYLLVYALYVGVMAFGVLPLLVTATTPFTYRDVMRGLKAPLITAFVTGKVIVVLPQLIEVTQELFRSARTDQAATTDANVKVLYPLAYPFPHLGKLAGLVFIPFAAWFVGDPLELLDYPVMLFAGLFSYFGGPVLATPFLLDLMRLPSDLMQLFFAAGVIAARLGDVLGVMHFVALTTIATAATAGMLRVDFLRLGRGLLVFGALTVACLLGVRFMLAHTFEGRFAKGDVLGTMQPVLETVETTEVEAAPNPTRVRPGEPPRDRLRAHGALRVALLADRIPFSYRGADGRWIGFDVEMANQLALEFGVKLELMEIGADDIRRALADDWADLVMGGLVETGPLSEDSALSAPYLSASVAGIVLDHRVDELGSWELLRRRPDLRIAVDDPRYRDRLQSAFPNAEVVGGEARAFLRGELEADVMVTLAESAFPLTIPHPEYEVIKPLPRPLAVPLVYALNPRYPRMADYVDRWIGRMERRGERSRLYDHWVLGAEFDRKPPRWSVVRNVLHWID